ncbi:hypothetical protein B0J13DRAFT_624343 [Dactylonectria estremocensis]|uniref:BZIP domain-containing protein n=1 Tax=Dactylonectria estremocensis TaxID=1079267 RepID=A0A9P9J082_9HYPO|nr:hypothetical protein B0J13DRAFT_624343 [Dactylonectria estremocensis]
MDSANSTLRKHVPRIEVDKSTNGLHPGTEAVIVPEKGVMEMPKPGSHFNSYTSFPKARQRSKTEIDRDRRRIDRLARNRQSARNSTLRKKLALETKEERIKELEVALETSLKANHVLVEELNLWRQMANFMTPAPDLCLDTIERNNSSISGNMADFQHTDTFNSPAAVPAMNNSLSSAEIHPAVSHLSFSFLISSEISHVITSGDSSELEETTVLGQNPALDWTGYHKAAQAQGEVQLAYGFANSAACNTSCH